MKTTHLAAITILTFGLSFTLAAQDPHSAPSAAAATAAASQSWIGTLVDATCRAADPAGKCEISPTTKSFGLMSSDGKYYKLDSTGSSQVEQALKQAKTSTGSLTATVTGSLQGDQITVSSVKIS